jgi:hypothetical protein
VLFGDICLQGLRAAFEAVRLHACTVVGQTDLAHAFDCQADRYVFLSSAHLVLSCGPLLRGLMLAGAAL